MIEKAASSSNSAVPRSGCFMINRAGKQNQGQGKVQVLQAVGNRFLILGKVFGQGQNQGDLNQFRGLEGKRGDGDPALRPGNASTE